MLPSAQITKIDGQTGVVRPSAEGVLAIVAASEKGDLDIASSFARTELAIDEFGYGPLTEDAAYVMPVSGKPVVLVRTDASTTAAYGAITGGGAGAGGTSVITAAATEPLDEFDVLVEFLTAGTIGVAGITYRYSLDGGTNYSKTLALGTANTLTIPDTGVALALAAGTIVVPRSVSFLTTAPSPTDVELPDSLEALRVTSSPWDAVYIDGESEAATVTIVDLFLKALNARGKFPIAFLNARRRGAAETEAAYKDALAIIFDAAASTDIIVAADVGDVASPIRGITQPRPAGLAVAARVMKIPLGRDPAYVADGPVPGFFITDARNNPKYHDESKYPGLDDLRLATLRTFDGKEGTYITNAPILSSSGSDYVYVQHARVINRGCEIAFQVLTGQLSVGVDKAQKPGPAGQRYIAEKDAQRIEELVNSQIGRELVATGQVADMKFTLSRTDDISSNAGATLTGTVQSVALGYVKKFTVTAGFVKQIGA